MTRFYVQFILFMSLSNSVVAQCGLNGDFLLPNAELAHKMEIGPDGSIYLIGVALGIGNDFITLEKRDAAGNILNNISIENATVFDLEVSDDSCVYICGYWDGVIDFGGGYSFNGSITAAQGFVAKYNADLQIQWAVVTEGNGSASGDGTDVMKSVSIDNNGNCFVSGEFGAYFSIDTIDISIPVSSKKAFLSKFDSNTGELNWLFPQDYPHPYSTYLEVDGFGEVYEVSWNYFNSAITIEKYDDAGVLNWQLSTVGANNTPDALQTDQNGNLEFIGNLGDSITIGGFSLYNLYYSGIFKCRISPGGNVLALNRIATANYFADFKLEQKSFHLLPSGSYYVSGYSADNLNFNGISSNNGTYSKKFFVTKYDSYNTPIWVSDFGVMNDYEVTVGARYVNNCNVFFFSNMHDTLLIDTLSFTAPVNEKMRLLVEIDDLTGEVLTLVDSITDPFGENGVGIEEFNESITVYPNPVQNSLHLLGLSEAVSIEIYSPTGKLISKQNEYKGTSVNLENVPTGIYYLHLSGNQFSKTIRFIKL